MRVILTMLLAAAVVAVSRAAPNEAPRHPRSRYAGRGYTVVFVKRPGVPVRMHEPFRHDYTRLAVRRNAARPDADLLLPRGVGRTGSMPVTTPVVSTRLRRTDDTVGIGEQGGEPADPFSVKGLTPELSWGWLADEVFTAKRAAKDVARLRRKAETQALWQHYLNPFEKGSRAGSRQPDVAFENLSRLGIPEE